jgi:putative protein-disulfide isomerase
MAWYYFSRLVLNERNNMSAILYYFHDPMCSWCYAFEPVLQGIKTGVPANLEIVSVLGGLSPDDDEPMPQSLQLTIQHHWQRIEQTVPETTFNYDFWSICTPRRSTYPACRAVIAAANQGMNFADSMNQAIQRAYYLEARNPSDYSTHIELAEQLHMDMGAFRNDLTSVETEEELTRQLYFTRSYNVPGFPALVLSINNQRQGISIDYTNAENVLKAIQNAM